MGRRSGGRRGGGHPHTHTHAHLAAPPPPRLLLFFFYATPPCNTIRLTTLQHGETQNLRARSVDYLNEKQCYYHSSSKSFFSLRIPIRCRPRRTPSMQQAQLTNGRSRRPPNSMLVTPSQNYPKQCAPRPTDKKTIDNKSKGSITGTHWGITTGVRESLLTTA